MIGDHVRMAAYSEALRRVVRPGSVVLDIGTGTGVFALLACGFGARKVHAVEPGDVIEVAREMAAASGFGQRITFINAQSGDVSLDERVDVMVSDLRGILPFYDRSIPAVIDARSRLLAEHGVVLAQRDTVWASIVEAPDLYRNEVNPWGEGATSFDIGPMRRVTANGLHKARVSPEQLVVSPRRWAEVDYRTVISPNASGVLTWQIERSAIGHGLLVWFDTTVIDGVEFSNAPGQAPTIYGNTFFPWLEPVTLDIDEEVRVDLRADLVGGDYVWSWKTQIFGRGSDRSKPRVTFRQSTFHGEVICRERLRRRDPAVRIDLNERGKIEMLILDALDRGEPVGSVASRLVREFPTRFPDPAMALGRVGDSAVRYGR
jgi:type I protein arginine methyltransferase